MSNKNNSKKPENDTQKSFVQRTFPCSGDKLSEIIRKIVFLVAFVIFVVVGIILLITLLQSREAMADKETHKDIIVTEVVTTINSDGAVETVPPSKEDKEQHNFDVMKYFTDISEDVIACIQIPACDIYDPIVQGEDNSYYLTHTYYDAVNKAGSVFLDYRATISEDFTSPNLVIYGHNQGDGTMFGNLKKFKNDLDFYAENPFITLNTLYGEEQYVIFAYFVTNTRPEQDSNGVVFNYHDYIDEIQNYSLFKLYMEEIQKRNSIISPVDVKFGDKLITLSTCSTEFTDSRFVIFGRKLRDGETTEDFDFSSVSFNPDALRFDWEAIMSNTSVQYLENNDNVIESLDFDNMLNEYNVLSDETSVETSVPTDLEENGTLE